MVHEQGLVMCGGRSLSYIERWDLCCRNVLASGSADGSVRVWNLQERKTLLLLPHPDKVTPLTCPQPTLT